MWWGGWGPESLKHLWQMWTNLLFFIKKKQISDFDISWISSTPMIPDGFLDFSGDMRTFPDLQECSEHIQSDSTLEKQWFSTQNQRISPVGPQTRSEVQSMMKLMVLDRQREPNGQLVINLIRKHSETSFPGLQVLSGASWGV